MSEADDLDRVRRFVEDFALILTGAGMQRMAARVWAALLSSDRGMTAREVAALLQVSPAAVSGAVRYLEQMSLLRRAREPGERTDRYAIGDDAWFEALATKTDTIESLIGSLDKGIAAVPSDGAAAAHMAETRDFFAYFVAELPSMLDRWHAMRTDST